MGLGGLLVHRFHDSRSWFTNVPGAELLPGSVKNAVHNHPLSMMVNAENNAVRVIDQVPDIFGEFLRLWNAGTAIREFLQGVDGRHKPAKPAFRGLWFFVDFSYKEDVFPGIFKSRIGNVNAKCQACCPAPSGPSWPV